VSSAARSGDPPERPLRLLFLSREYPPETGGGGIGSYVQSMARALARRGHDVHVLSCDEGQEASDRYDAGVQLHRRGVARILPKVRRRLPATARRLEGAVARYREYRRLGLAFDVIEAPDWLAEGLVFALLRPRPLVAHLHTPLFLVGRHNPTSFTWTGDRRLADRIERLAVRRADVVTSPSRLLAHDLAAEGWTGRRDPRIVRYPIELRPWSGLPPAGQSAPRVLAIGRLEARKAPEALVRASALLREKVPELDVVFIGSSGLHNGGEYRDWLVELAGRLAAPCRFVDEVPRHELPAWYGSARVVAVASRYDNFPYAGLEAMASARPVVCTESTGIAELITGTGAGAVVPVDDSGRLADALRPFLVDAAAAGHAGSEAVAIVARECSPDEVARQREACYLDAMRLSAARGRHRA
jgi:glycogen synthase